MSVFPGEFSALRRALSYRQHFARQWAAFLHENFTSPEDVGVVFAVDGSTARKWWAGSHAPSGFAVGLAFVVAHDAAAKKLREAA